MEEVPSMAVMTNKRRAERRQVLLSWQIARHADATSKFGFSSSFPVLTFASLHSALHRMCSRHRGHVPPASISTELIGVACSVGHDRQG
jgi:hypothetical protein